MGILASIFIWYYYMSASSRSTQKTSSEPLKLIKATITDIDKVAPLFDLYRQFYHQESDIELSRKYIGERIKTSSSTIYLALDANGTPLGFTQLYPSYCSVDAAPILILYDLYVAHSARKKGVATALMNRALQLAKETTVSRIDLETHHTNTAAQALYESLCYKRDNEYYKYSLEL